MIVQLSDLHLVAPGRLAYGLLDTWRNTETALDRVSRMAPSPLLLVLSGDLADEAEPAAYARLAAALRQMGMPVMALPGNHDRRAPLAAALGLGDGPLDRIVQLGPLDVFGLDTLREGEGQGGLDPPQLDRLEAGLAADPDRPALLVLHHPPGLDGRGEADPEGFLGGRALAAILARHRRVQALACGHVHRAMTTRFAGVPLVVAPPVNYGRPLAPPGRESLHAVEGEGFAVHRLLADNALVTDVLPLAVAPELLRLFRGSGEIVPRPPWQ